MSLRTELVGSFERSFGLYTDFLQAIDETSLAARLPGLPSNTIGMQLWCVVGARESYSHAIAAGEWTGFSCSLETTTRKEDVGSALLRSAASVIDVLQSTETFTDVQSRLVLDLLEHEAAHHGQLIRYLYGLKLPIPESWKARFALKAT